MSERRGHHTIKWIVRGSCPTILGMLAAISLCACSSPMEKHEKNLFADSSGSPAAPVAQDTASPQPPSPDPRDTDGSQHQAEPSPPHPAPVATQTEPERVESAPATAPPALKRIDPGAAYITSQIRERLESHDRSADRLSRDLMVVIDISPIRNQSRARPAEFTAFISRFAALLTDAGEEGGLSFTSEPDAEADYELLGTAYLLAADGFDWWELFLNLRPKNEKWTLWRCEYPVRVMRHPRPGHQQVFIVPLPRVRN